MNPINTAPTAPGIPGAAPVLAAPNNGSTAPIPTTAPTGQTSTAAPAATPVSTPTAVVSSAPAVAQAQTIKNTVAQGTAGMAAQSAKAAVAANPYSVLPGETTDAYNTRIAAYNASKVATTPAAPVPKTPEEQLADTPDTGNQWIYDAQGNRTQVPITEPVLPGFSTTNPHAGPSTPVADSTTDPVGNVYKQFTDGTYGKYNAAGVYVGTASAGDFNSSKTGENLMSSIAQVANGTYPLTSAQQSQVDGIKAQFQQLIQAQQVANANFTGGTTVAENLYGMGNSLTGLGEIKGTVDSGLAKIADLNGKMASAIATMEASFQTDDMNLLKGAYDTYSQAVKSRQAELDTIQAAAQKALVDAQNAARENETLKLTKMMDDNTISYQAKQLALDQSTLDEKTKNDIESQQLERLKYNLDVKKENFTERQAAAAAAGSSIGNGLPTVGYTANGLPDPAKQAQFLNSLHGGPNGPIAIDVKGLADYTIDPTTFTVRTLKGGTQLTRDQYIALAKQYNPNYNESNYAAAAKYNASFKSTSGNSTGATLAAANKGIVHLASFFQGVKSLNNLPINALNSLTNAVNINPSYRSALSNTNTLSLGVSSELGKFFKGTSSALDQKTIEDWQGQINPNLSPGDQEGLKKSTISLLTGQLDVAYADYETAMGHAPPAPGQPGSILTAPALAALKQIGVDTSNYDGIQPYSSTSDTDLVNTAPSNSGETPGNTSDFFNNI